MISETHHLMQEDATGKDFQYMLEQFADLRILRYQVPGFNELTISQKKLIYFLSQAAICGRDILWDQNGRYNLAIRVFLENIYTTYTGNRSGKLYKDFVVYIKRVWFSNGIYHHYSNAKILPHFPKKFFSELVSHSNEGGFPKLEGLTREQTVLKLVDVIYDTDTLGYKVSQISGHDMVSDSAVNFYRNVNQKEVEAYYRTIQSKDPKNPISYGLNTRVIKEDGLIQEKVWCKEGLYGAAIERIVFWLQKALSVAETWEQEEGLRKLISYYDNGDLTTWDDYNIIWVKDTSDIDFVNGFIETYSDPLGMKATWEAIVNFKDTKATHRTEIIAHNAQWFEDNSPINECYKKKKVTGVSAKVITVAMLGGDCYPHTPIGINLPNSEWIRKEHGSKSVTIENITQAYNQANLLSGFLEEFSYDTAEYELVKKYGFLTDNLHTDLHECLGHGSGQLREGVTTDVLKNYYAVLEETRADLYALYYIMDPQMVKLKLLPCLEAAKAQYISYIRNGLMTQLYRIEPGKTIEQAHMRNRQLISAWCYNEGLNNNVIEHIERDSKTYFRINDFNALRTLFGQLLYEVQRIKSEGDYEAGRKLVEEYGVQVDKKLHSEVLKRFENINMAPYSGFVNPEYELITDDDVIKDVKIKYATDYAGQMLHYSENYSFLPIEQ